MLERVNPVLLLTTGAALVIVGVAIVPWVSGGPLSAADGVFGAVLDAIRPIDLRGQGLLDRLLLVRAPIAQQAGAALALAAAASTILGGKEWREGLGAAGVLGAITTSWFAYLAVRLPSVADGAQAFGPLDEVVIAPGGAMAVLGLALVTAATAVARLSPSR